MRLDALGQRLQRPISWGVVVVAVVTVGVFAATWLAGSPAAVVALSTLVAALLAAAGLTASGSVFRSRAVRILAHELLGAFVLFVAFVATLFGAAAGVLTASAVDVAMLGSVWGLGIALVLAGGFVYFEADRLLRLTVTFGLLVTAVWGLAVALVLGGVAVHFLLEGFDVALVQDLRDDLVPFLALFVALAVLPALVFVQDIRELRADTSTEP